MLTHVRGTALDTAFLSNIVTDFSPIYSSHQARAMLRHRRYCRNLQAPAPQDSRNASLGLASPTTIVHDGVSSTGSTSTEHLPPEEMLDSHHNPKMLGYKFTHHAFRVNASVPLLRLHQPVCNLFRQYPHAPHPAYPVSSSTSWNLFILNMEEVGYSYGSSTITWRSLPLPAIV
ncbi:hypothetical protein B0H34DRAFT_346198 [Crassisporium funariophilum]|nr:hypothetical protein B0H34DRAFT_346198 [Crassisporium funariophilum]